ncbi:hypothetical protein CEP53_000009 [Fusarium sp. AF-6]|nr:hypothetical protein CEP53_000009 [Fusarium sp. AF-6]
MEVRRLFYPGQPSDESNLTRRQGLLSELNDDAYTRVYRRIVDRPGLVFPDVQKLLKTTKEEGRIMMQVLTHVVAWLNPSPTVIIDKRQNNKPLIREDLKPAIWQIQAASQSRDGNNKNEANSETIWKEGQSTQLETLSIQLEKVVLDVVRDHMRLFKSVAIKNSLSIFPDDDKDGYQERFANEPWKKVVDKVEEIIGPVFESSLQPATFPTTRDDTDNDQPMSKITREICARVLEIPNVARDPALQCPEAYQELSASINQAVLQWTRRWSHHQHGDSRDTTESYERRDPVKDSQAPYQSQRTSNACVSPTRDKNGQDQIDSTISQSPGLPHSVTNNTPLEEGQRANRKTKPDSQVSWPSFQSLFSRNEGYLS